MTLGTHFVAGAYVGLAVHNLPLAAVLGFSSHFILDAIPHWDYSLSSEEPGKNGQEKDFAMDKRFVKDLFKLSLDIGIGVVVVAVLLWRAAPMAIIGAIVGGTFGVLPDLLQFVYFHYKWHFLRPLQWFHTSFMHAKTQLNDEIVLGVGSQVAIIVFLSYLIMNTK